jgi:protoporphyrinogen oxidase
MPEADPRGNRSVVVLGAGLTGMSAALELQRRGVDHWLLEREPHVGGLASTTYDSGYRFDRTGHLLHVRDAERKRQILSLLDAEPLEVRRSSFVYSENVFTRYPYQSNVYGLPPATAFACVMDFIRSHQHPPASAPDNFEDFCRAHFGDAISEHFMIPYNHRLWGVPPCEITTTWCQRFVPIPTIEDVVAGAVGHNARELGYNVSGIYPRHGIGELSDALGRRVTALRLSCAPKSIDAKRRVIHGNGWSIGYRALISTLPLPKLLELIDAVPEPIARAGRQLRCTSLYYLDIALRHPPRHSMHWAYVPETRFPFYRVGNYAAFSPEMAPAGKACLYVELASRAEPELERVWPEVEAGLLEMGFLACSADVVFCRVRRIDHAYVIYDRARDAALTAIEAYLETLGIVSSGRYGGWNYSSMEDALAFGERAAAQAIETLT